MAPLHPEGARLFRWVTLATYPDRLLVALTNPHALPEIAALASQGPPIGRQDSQHKYFDVVHHLGVLDRVPTEVIPELAASAHGGADYSPLDPAFSHVHRH